MIFQKRGMVGILLVGAITALVFTGFATYYHLLKNTMSIVDNKLMAATIAKTELEKVSHLSASEITSKKNALETGYTVGDYFVRFVIGESGGFKNGVCNSAVSGSSYDRCFKNSFVVVALNGTALYTSRMSPLIAGNYSREEIFDSLKEYIRNNNYNDVSGAGELSLNVVAKTDGKFAIEAYSDGQSVSLYKSKELMGPPDTGSKISISLPYTVPENGYVFIHQAGYGRTRIDGISSSGQNLGAVLDFVVPGMAWGPVTKGDYLYYASRNSTLNIGTPYFMPCMKVKT